MEGNFKRVFRVFRVFIDGDNCAKLVREYLVKKALDKAIELIFVSNGAGKLLWSEEERKALQIVTTGGAQGATDEWIMQNIALGDVLITRDVLFAARVVEKGICALNDRGVVFKADKIASLTKERNFNLQLAHLGLVDSKKTVYNERDLEKFVTAFEKISS